ncbi:hypothetical protein PRIPAC_79746 [Pristionchus pacificus]|uniref:Uncharacterized protein n=1 Tax=Pristionchus pacificus TaxID=54126 RepID=A0A454Y297_PRIPA|nr:hypothetical protein PRIPAC_79746 [Pristionchus pacificus]|eukprot:PDM78775.1 hypothetical protein PRIPAC_31354 [Pristionchus pacificus]
MADIEPTPEMIAQFMAGRAAVKLRDLVISDEQDIGKFHAVAESIKAGLSEDVLKELEKHNEEVAKAIGLIPSA